VRRTNSHWYLPSQNDNDPLLGIEVALPKTRLQEVRAGYKHHALDSYYMIPRFPKVNINTSPQIKQRHHRLHLSLLWSRRAADPPHVSHSAQEFLVRLDLSPKLKMNKNIADTLGSVRRTPSIAQSYPILLLPSHKPYPSNIKETTSQYYTLYGISVFGI
jgi:hypothetical protein